MKAFMLIAASAGAIVLAAAPADARGGCGIGLHRGPAGYCRPNRGRPVVVGGPRIVIGGYYPGRGYWDGRRYRGRRYRRGGGWRYR